MTSKSSFCDYESLIVTKKKKKKKKKLESCKWSSLQQQKIYFYTRWY